MGGLVLAMTLVATFTSASSFIGGPGVAYEKGLSIKAEILPDLWIDGDSIQLKLLISILIDNAIRHSENGNNIVVKLTESRISVILSVENSGKLIPPEQQERLFDRFYRVDDARNSEDNHYGLGLAIANTTLFSITQTYMNTSTERY